MPSSEGQQSGCRQAFENILKLRFKILQSVTQGAPTSAAAATTVDNIVEELNNK